MRDLNYSANTACRIGQAVVGELPTDLEPAQLTRISWAHFIELIRYLTALPSAEQLKAFLDRDRAEIKARTLSNNNP